MQLLNTYASCIAIGKKGILLLGKSGSGKSDLSLRLIQNKKAKLVADDRVNLEKRGQKIFASSPESIKGLLEVRGVGICKFDSIAEAELCLVVELCENIKDMQRLPTNDFWVFEDLKVKKIKLYPFELSAVDKLELACK